MVQFLVILGLHSSGSSAVAGVCYHLGCHMGARLGGYYGSDPAVACGFEAAKLARICEQAIPFPATDRVQSWDVVRANLQSWLAKLGAEAQRMGSVPALKYPLLCRLHDELVSAAGGIDRMRVVHIDRPLHESIASLARRCPHRPRGQVEVHQGWLQQGKRAFLGRMLREQVLHLSYDQLLADPLDVAGRIARFAGVDVGPDRIRRAAAYVDARKRHVGRVATG